MLILGLAECSLIGFLYGNLFSLYPLLTLRYH